MHATVFHDRHYDWQIVKKNELVDGDTFQPAAKEDEVLRRTTVDQPGNFTICDIPQALIDRYVHDRATVGKPRTFSQAVYDYLSQVGLQMHTEGGWISYIRIDDDPWWEGGDRKKLEKYLNTAFETTANSAAEAKRRGETPRNDDDDDAPYGSLPDDGKTVVIPNAGQEEQQ
jgi:hypothetical protein